MRVIAGRAGGVPLVSPKNGVRPTMDRVKEAIFSSLGEMVARARVLDLFDHPRRHARNAGSRREARLCGSAG